MDFLILFLLNIASLAVMYLLLRKRVDSKYTHESFLNKIHSEVGQIITEMNQTTERNIQLMEHKLESLQTMGKRVQDLITRGNSEIHDMQDRYSQLVVQKPYGTNNKIHTSGIQASEQVQIYKTEMNSTMDTSNTASKDTASKDRLQVHVSENTEKAKSSESSDDFHSDSERTNRKDQKNSATKLYLQGEDLPAIAEKTGLSLGEVELIVALIRK